MSKYRAYHGRNRLDNVDYLSAEDAWKALHSWYDNKTEFIDEFEVSLREVDEIGEILFELETLKEPGMIYILEPSDFIGEDISRSAVSVRKVA